MASNWYQQVQLLSVLKILAFKIIMSIGDQNLIDQVFEMECECGQNMTDHPWWFLESWKKVSTSILQHICLPGKGEDGNVIMLMLTINDPEIHKII